LLGMRLARLLVGLIAAMTMTGCGAWVSTGVDNDGPLLTDGPIWYVYGDSHWMGYELADPATQSVASVMSEKRGWTPVNHAYPGDNFFDLPLRMDWTVPITPTTFTLLGEGTNQVTSTCMIDGCSATVPPSALHLAIFSAQVEAMLLYFGTPDAAKVKASAMQLAGAWQPLNSTAASAPVWSEVSTTVGDTATFSVSGTRVDLIAGITKASQSSFVVTIDGVGMTDSINGVAGGGGFRSYTDMSGRNGGTYGLVDYKFTGLSNGAHTVVVTNQGPAGNGLSLFWAQGTTPGTTTNLATVTLSQVSRFGTCAVDYPWHSDLAVSQFLAPELAAVNELNAAGYSILTSGYSDAGEWNPNDPTETFPDCEHPRYPKGIEGIANQFLTVLPVDVP
jgi:hypothetical protein